MMKRVVIVMMLVSLSNASVRADYVPFSGQDDNPTAPVGGVNTAGHWEGGVLPSGNSTGLVVSAANVWSGNAWLDLAIRQEGGFISSTELGLRGGSAGTGITTVYEIEDARADYSNYTNICVNGTLSLWSQFGENMELNLLRGHVEATTLGLSAPGTGTVNLRDGIFHVGSLSDARGTVNMLSGGTGRLTVDVLNTSLDSEFFLNFETGSRSVFTFGEKSGGESASGIWAWMVRNRHVSIDNSVTTDLALFAIEEFGLQSAIRLASPGATSKKAPAPYPTAFLYQMETGVVADLIPYYMNGKVHLVHLQLKPGQKGWDWAEIVTEDFVDYAYPGVVLTGPDNEEAPDHDIFTGSVFEKDGLLYAFYSGHSKVLDKKEGASFQQVFRAVSPDGAAWTKTPDFLFNTGGHSAYRFPNACRDPFVFWNSDENEYGMLITASAVDHPCGSLAYASSSDLLNWELKEPFPASGRFPGYECPDIFYWGDRWYLVFSTYFSNPGWATRYMMAPSLSGPWTSPVDDFFDGGSFYAAKSVSDGTRRFLCGTLTRREKKQDEDVNGWGGRILVYEMVRRDDATLGVRIPPAVEESYGSLKEVARPANSVWRETRTGLRSVAGAARLQLGALPDRCLLQFSLTVPPTGRVGVWVGGSSDSKQAFRLYVDTDTQRLVWDRDHLPLGGDPEKERPYRPLHVQPGDRILVKVLLDGDAAVACVNDDTCLSVRMYDRRDNTFGIWSDTTGASIEGMQLRCVGDENSIER